MNSSSAQPHTPDGPGSVSGAPNLAIGFTETFTSRYIETASHPYGDRRTATHDPRASASSVR